MLHDKKTSIGLLISSAIVILLVIYFFNHNPPKVVTTKPEENIEKVNRIRVNLEVLDAKENEKFSTKLDEGSTLYSLMEHYRKKGNIKYDLTNYSYGEILESLNDIDNDKTTNKQWNLYINNKLQTGIIKIKEIKLEKDNTYKWIYEEKKSEQNIQ